MENILVISETRLKEILQEFLSESLKPQPKQDLITRPQAAKILGISLPTMMKYAKLGIIKEYRLGTRVRYKKDEIENSIDVISKMLNNINE